MIKNPTSPDLFFPKTGKEEAACITNFCIRCTVRPQCKAKGDRMRAEIGVWGGEKRKPK